MAAQPKYNREVLINSDLFAEYQKDFLAALLPKPKYTIAEAQKIVSDFFNKE